MRRTLEQQTEDDTVTWSVIKSQGPAGTKKSVPSMGEEETHLNSLHDENITNKSAKKRGKKKSVIPTLSPDGGSTVTTFSTNSKCKNDENWKVGGASIFTGMNCADFTEAKSNELYCNKIQELQDGEFDGSTMKEACW